jgi:hypothetical protein
MTAFWVAVAALAVASVALWHSRRTSRELAQVTEMYWQLKFDHGELKAKVAPPPPVQPPAQQTFVSLTSLRSASAPESFGGTGPAGEAGSTQRR